MKPVKSAATLLAVLGLAAPALAADGLLITETTTTGSTTETRQIRLEAHRMRVDAGSSQAVVFDGPAQVMRVINEANKTYTEITRADLDRMGQMMAQMQEQLKNMPPEQRAQVEAMMRGRGAGAAMAQPKTEYRRTGTDRVGAWTCDTYDAVQDGKTIAEICTVPPSTLGFTQADFAVTREMADFVQALVPPGMNSQELFAIGDERATGFSGVPVRRTSPGTPPATTQIQSVTRQDFPDSVFAVPEGYRKQALPMMPQGR